MKDKRLGGYTMDFKEHFHTALQAFAVGALVMAYIADYNTRQLPIASVAVALSILLRILQNRYRRR